MQSYADIDEPTRESPRRANAESGVVPALAKSGRAVVPAPRTIVRRAFGSMRGCVVAKRYRITRAIGAGGMGTVYEAVDLQTGVEVALKALTRPNGNVNALKRLRREAETAVAVRSDYVCQVHYLGVEEGIPFIVMERLHGEPLRARLNALGAFSLADTLAIMGQLLDALAATHATGVIHRDVKPSNVFMTSRRDERPRLKLIDFGLAKLLQEQGLTGGPTDLITAPNNIPGTLQYLAPEQLLGAAVDQRVDVYAAGLAFYEMLTGVRAYHTQGGALDDLVQRIIFEPPPRPTEIRDDLPDAVDDIVAMALAKDPSRRFLTASAFRRALTSIAGTTSGIVNAPPSFRGEAATLLDLEIDIEGEPATSDERVVR